MPPKGKYTDPKLRDEIKEELKESDKGKKTTVAKQLLPVGSCTAPSWSFDWAYYSGLFVDSDAL